MSTPAFLALGAFALVLLKFLTTLIQNHRFSRAHNCKAAPRKPQTERIIGYDDFKLSVANFKAKALLPESVRRFETVGDTFTLVVMGEKLWFTREPENVKAILATNFKDFGIGQRLKSMGALLGQGIFTSDGALWEHSRVSIPLPLSVGEGKDAKCT